MNIDSANDHGSWSIPVHMSNLCQEIIHPTKPIQSIDDENGEIGICILSALNLLELHNDEDIANACDIAVRTLDAVIDYQDYPVKAGENFTKNRRSLGIGITNLAGFLAKNKLHYDDPEALTTIHELMEKIQWNLINTSCDLSKEKGQCNKFNDTKYAKGLLPIDWYKKSVDDLVKPEYTMDWEGLRKKVWEFGLRHSTLSAIMKQLVPNFYNRKNYYTTAWSLKSNQPIMNIAAVIQKFVDMSMSVNLYYNYAHYPDGNIPLSVLIKDQVYGYKFGLKNFYYANTPDGDGETEKEMNCESGACAI
jgi:ribonucleoside-diphosphate reductase alpha chain